MVLKDEQALLAHIKNDEIRPVYLLAGDEAYLTKMYAKTLAQKALPEGLTEYNYTRFESGKTSSDEIADALFSVPFGGGVRAVQVDDIDFDKLTQDDFAKLCELIENLPDEAVLLLCQAGTISRKKNSRPAKVADLAGTYGAAVTLAARGQADLIRFITVLCQQNGVEISPAAAKTLISCCGQDMTFLKNEAQKLCAFCESGHITPEDVLKLCPPALEGNVFNLAKKITAGNLGGAMGELDDLIGLGYEPLAILGAFHTNFIDTARAKAAMQSGRSQQDLIAAFPGAYKGKEFRVKNAWQAAAHTGSGQIFAILTALAQADYQMKSTKTDPVILLQEAFAQIYLILHPQERGL